jgi:hypothetical protein
MSGEYAADVLREDAPNFWRGFVSGYHVRVFQAEGRWVGQALTHNHGFHARADSRTEAERKVREWIGRNPAPPAGSP